MKDSRRGVWRLATGISLAAFSLTLLAPPAAALRPGDVCPPASVAQLVAQGGSCHGLGMPECQSVLGCFGTVPAVPAAAPVIGLATVGQKVAMSAPVALHDLFAAGPPTPPPNR